MWNNEVLEVLHKFCAILKIWSSSLPDQCTMSFSIHWATTEYHSFSSCAISSRATNRISLTIISINLVDYFIRDLPLACVPSILPKGTSFSRHFLLNIRPRNQSCCVLTTLINFFHTPVNSNTLSFLILAVRGIRSILLRNIVCDVSNRFLCFKSSA